MNPGSGARLTPRNSVMVSVLGGVVWLNDDESRQVPLEGPHSKIAPLGLDCAEQQLAHSRERNDDGSTSDEISEGVSPAWIETSIDQRRCRHRVDDHDLGA